jgi:hypothetical protein
MINSLIRFLTLFSCFMLTGSLSQAEVIRQYHVYELLFEVTGFSPGDSQVRDVIHETTWKPGPMTVMLNPH